MTIEFNREAYNKVFDDLERFREYCRYEGKKYDEKFLYNDDSSVWQSYKRWQHWMKNKKNKTKKNKRTTH
tara:strand:- start:314 stop:523 length:210 start_codon:yes stop_codon:yes gene_type:complete